VSASLQHLHPRPRKRHVDGRMPPLGYDVKNRKLVVNVHDSMKYA
jgi:hypothetical protein